MCEASQRDKQKSRSDYFDATFREAAACSHLGINPFVAFKLMDHHCESYKSQDWLGLFALMFPNIWNDVFLFLFSLFLVKVIIVLSLDCGDWVDLTLEESWFFVSRIKLSPLAFSPFQSSSHCRICFWLLSLGSLLGTLLKAPTECRATEIIHTPPKAMSIGYCQSLSRFYVKLQIYAVGIDQMTKCLFIFPPQSN